MDKKQKFRFGFFLVTIGIVYGDIGTSPLYVMKSILEGNGGISWGRCPSPTLTAR